MSLFLIQTPFRKQHEPCLLIVLQTVNEFRLTTNLSKMFSVYVCCLYWVKQRFSCSEVVSFSFSLLLSWRRPSSWYETPLLQVFSATWVQAAMWICASSPRPAWRSCGATTSPRPRAEGEPQLMQLSDLLWPPSSYRILDYHAEVNLIILMLL